MAYFYTIHDYLQLVKQNGRYFNCAIYGQFQIKLIVAKIKKLDKSRIIM